jgi:hypothetical protein
LLVVGRVERFYVGSLGGQVGRLHSGNVRAYKKLIHDGEVLVEEGLERIPDEFLIAI